MPKLLCCLVVMIASIYIANAAEPQTKSKRHFPAKLQVASSKMSDDGYRELELHIALAKDVEIYEEWDEKGLSTGLPNAKISIVTADGTPVEAEVAYSQPNVTEKIEGVGTFHSYSGILKLTARFKPPLNGGDLKIGCRLAGMNRRKSYCLGYGRIETELPAESKR